MKTFQHQHINPLSVIQNLVGKILTRNEHLLGGGGGFKIKVEGYKECKCGCIDCFYKYIIAVSRERFGSYVTDGYCIWDKNGKSFWNEVGDIDREDTIL